MVDQQYREANELADILDFNTAGSQSERAKRDPIIAAEYASDIAYWREKLAEQERIDGRPADPKEQRQGFLGAT